MARVHQEPGSFGSRIGNRGGSSTPIKMNVEWISANSGRGPVAGRCEKSLEGARFMTRGRTGSAKEKTAAKIIRFAGVPIPQSIPRRPESGRDPGRAPAAVSLQRTKGPRGN